MISVPYRTPVELTPAQQPYEPNAPNVIDLFSGAGGFSLGAIAAGCNIVAAFEQDPVTAYTYHVNLCRRRTRALFRDATQLRTDVLPNVDVILAGPPCQPWSSASGASDTDDPRRELLYLPVQWAIETDADVVLLENVPNLKHQYTDAYHRLKTEFSDAGYVVRDSVLDAADYHTPQHRERLFIIAASTDLTGNIDSWFPSPTTGTVDAQQTTLTAAPQHTSVEPYITTQEALSGLPRPIQSEPPKDDPVHKTIDDQPFMTVERDGTHRVDPHTTPTTIPRNGDSVRIPANHVAADHHDRTRHKYSEMRHGYTNDDGTGSTTDRRLDPNEPAQTMTCSNGTPPVHYQGKAPNTPTEPVSKVRRLTPREVGRLQGFPDTFAVAGTREEQFRQFANAVPPTLAAQLCHHITTTILQRPTRNTATPQRVTCSHD